MFEPSVCDTIGQLYRSMVTVTNRTADRVASANPHLLPLRVQRLGVQAQLPRVPCLASQRPELRSQRLSFLELKVLLWPTGRGQNSIASIKKIKALSMARLPTGPPCSSPGPSRRQRTLQPLVSSRPVGEWLSLVTEDRAW